MDQETIDELWQIGKKESTGEVGLKPKFHSQVGLCRLSPEEPMKQAACRTV